MRAVVNILSGQIFEDTWHSDFYKKRVLIIGTGPSLDNFPQSSFAKYDTLVGVNFGAKVAINYSPNSYFFSTDINGLNSVAKNMHDFWEIFRKERVIFAPYFLGGGAFSLVKYARNVTIIKAKSYHSASWFELAHPSVPTEFEVTSWLDQSQVDYQFPIYPHTSALSAVLFSAFHRPTSIDMIGCDFSKGRSKVVKSFDSDSLTGRFGAADGCVIAFKNILRERKVELNNLSSQYGC